MKSKILLLILLGLTICNIFSSHFVNDDYMATYSAWLISKGKIANMDYHSDSYTLLFYLMSSVYFLVEKVSFHEIISYRLIQLPIIIYTFFITYKVSECYFNKKTALHATLIVFFSHAALSRIIDLRPDIYIIAISLTIILILQNSNIQVRRFFFLSFLFSISFLFKFKSLVFSPIYFFIFIYKKKWKTLNFKLLILTFLGLLVPFILFSLVYGYQELLRFSKTNYSLIIGISNNLSVPSNVKINTLLKTILLNPIHILLFILGSTYIVKNIKENIPLLPYVIFPIFFICINPNFYYYNIYTILILATPIICKAIEKSNDKFIIIILFFMISFWFNSPVKINNEHQLSLNNFIKKNINSNDHIFSFEGIGLNRPSTYHWRSSYIMMGDYKNNDFTIRDELNNKPPILIIDNYRTKNWLSKSDREFINHNYTYLYKDLLTLGKKFQKTVYYKPIKSGFYEIKNNENCLVGKNITKAKIVYFNKNKNYLIHVNSGSCTIRWHFNDQSINKLRNSNPNNYPYLIAP